MTAETGRHATDAASKESAEWWRWRGEVDAENKANSDRIADMATGLNHRLTDLGLMIKQRLDAQDVQIGKTLEQTLKTNGRITGAEERIGGLTSQLAHLDGLQEGEERVEVKKVRRIQTSRFSLRTLVSAMFGAACAAGGLATALTALHIV